MFGWSGAPFKGNKLGLPLYPPDWILFRTSKDFGLVEEAAAMRASKLPPPSSMQGLKHIVMKGILQRNMEKCQTVEGLMFRP